MEINKNEHATMIALMTNDKGLKINDMKSCHFPSAEQLKGEVATGLPLIT